MNTMSMLAERKRKQKWSLNPRGNDWVQDSNKFGQKMLEKMGWQHGKGLGAKEDGIKEHIKVSYKNDSKGMGFKESNDQWTEHEMNFSSLLESLSGGKPDKVEVKSLEKKSQSSRARVHYHKFTRGKDLSRYSEKDLANIFGKKSLKESETKIEEDKIDSVKEKIENDSKFIFNAGSMKDYFKKKLPSFGKSNGYVVGHNGVLKKEESHTEHNVASTINFNSDKEDKVSYVGFGFKSEVTSDKKDENNSSANPTFISYVNGDCTEESIEKKIKKKRKIDENEIDNVFSPKKKSRKNKGDRKKLDGNKGISNPAFNPLRTPVKIQKHILNTIEESISENVSDTEEDSIECVTVSAQIHEGMSDSPKHKNKSGHIETESGEKNKVKKPKGLEKGIVNGLFLDLTVNGDENIETRISPYEVKRKEGKKKKNGNKFAQEDSVQDFSLDKNSFEGKVKKSNKKKNDTTKSRSIDLTVDESQETNVAYENPNFQENAADFSSVLQSEENPYEVKIKKSKKKKKQGESVDLTSEDPKTDSKADEKKKKRKTTALENPCFNDALDDSIDLTKIGENPYEVIPKTKNKDKLFALENPNFNGTLEESIDLTQMEENPYEVKPKKKKKKSKGVRNESTETSSNFSQNEENTYEVSVPQKKKMKKHNNFAIENPNFNDSIEEPVTNEVEHNPYEVKPKKRKKKKQDATFALDNPNFDPNDMILNTSTANIVDNLESKKQNVEDTPSNGLSSDIKEDISLNIEESDLMLNIVTTPIIKKSNENSYSVTQINSVKRRKSVRFSDITQERIIPNNDDIRNLSDIESRNELFEINTQVINRNLEEQNISFDMTSLDMSTREDVLSVTKPKRGLDNAAFDKQKTNLEENIDSISKTIERYQAEIENDINEKKLKTLTIEDIMIGEVGNPHGDHEKLPDGTKLKFKHANFVSRTPFYHLVQTGARKSYKHLIKGDIVVGFKNTNLHEVHGYAAKAKSSDV